MPLGRGDVSKATQLQMEELLGEHGACGGRKKSPEAVALLNGLECSRVWYQADFCHLQVGDLGRKKPRILTRVLVQSARG